MIQRLVIAFMCTALTGCATRTPTQCGHPPLGLPQGASMMAPPQGMPPQMMHQQTPAAAPKYSPEEESRRRDPNCKLVVTRPGFRSYECTPPAVQK